MLLPLLLLYLILSEALGLVVALATPIADLFPKGTFDKIEHPVLMGLALIVAASFLIGLAMRSSAGVRLGNWIEKNTVSRIPAYGFVKSLTKGLVGAEEAAAFKAAVLASQDGAREIVYVIEDHGDGEMTVLVPWAPASFAGSIKIVARDRIEILDSNLGDVSRAIGHLGVGVRDLLGKGGK
ncbi:MAG: DUF502 domain-containing protein [Deltaproteobacteria bacterium]|nr:DUF502 domain-containing protein [Deltaproteobacteria bacterium]MBW2259338.1 DUF502 domain-containing protein [Deltaproteobacteria bacterium]